MRGISKTLGRLDRPPCHPRTRRPRASLMPTGDDLRQARQAVGKTQKQIAAAAHLHVNSVKRIERFRSAEISPHSWHALSQISKALVTFGASAPPDWLDPESRATGSSKDQRIPQLRIDGAANYRSATATQYAQAQARDGVIAGDNIVRGTHARAPARHGVRSAADNHPSAPRRIKCEARTRAGGSCRCKALANGRCKFHGGLSTGPRTPEGRARIAEAQRRRWARNRA